MSPTAESVLQAGSSSKLQRVVRRDSNSNGATAGATNGTGGKRERSPAAAKQIGLQKMPSNGVVDHSSNGTSAGQGMLHQAASSVSRANVSDGARRRLSSSGSRSAVKPATAETPFSEDIAQLASEVEHLLRPAVRVEAMAELPKIERQSSRASMAAGQSRQSVSVASSSLNDDSDVRPLTDHDQVALPEFSSDELFRLMQGPADSPALQQDFELSNRPSAQLPANRSAAPIRQQQPSVASMSDTPTDPHLSIDTSVSMPMLPPSNFAPTMIPATQQPVFVHVPVPMMPPPGVVAENLNSDTEVNIPAPETKLPEPHTIEAPNTVDSPETEGQPPSSETDDENPGAGVDAQNIQAEQIREAQAIIAKRLANAVKRAKKDLYLMQDPLPEKQPRKIAKLINELEAGLTPDKETLLIRRLGSTRSAAVVEPLREFSEGRSDLVRIAVIQAMTQIPDAASSILLLNQLADASSDVVHESIRGLVFLRREESLHPLIAVALKDTAHRTVLQDAMLAEDDAVQKEFADRLKEFLNSKDDDVAVVALGLISRLGGENQLKLYSKLLGRKPEKLRAAAIDAMAASGENQSVRHLNSAMKDESALVRAAAANGLASIHSPRSSVLLLEGLQDSEVRVRRSCAKSLAQIDDQRISKGVAVALKNETDPATIEYLLQALGKTGSPEAVAILEKYLNSGDKVLCHRALTILRRLRERKAAKLVLPFLEDADMNTRRQAAETLGFLQDTSVVPQLIKVLKADKSSAVTAAAARALGELNDEKAVPALEEALYEDRNTKSQAVIALGRIKSKSSIPALLAQLRDPAAEVRYHACVALGQMEKVPNPELLRELLDDKDPMVQRGAKAALEKLGVKFKSGRFANKLRGMAASLVPSQLAGGLPLGATAIAVLIIGGLGYGGYALSSAGLSGPTFRISDVQYVAVSGDGKLATASRKLKVFETWDLATGTIVHRMELTSGASGVFYADDTRMLVVEGGAVKSLDARNDSTAESLKDTGLKLGTHCVARAADGRLAAFCSATGAGKIVDLEQNVVTGKPFMIPKFHPESKLAMTNDGKLLLVGAPDGVIVVINLNDGAALGSVSLPNVLQASKVALASMTLNHSSSVLAVGTRQGAVLVFDLNAGMKLLGKPHDGATGILELAFMEDRLVFADMAGKFGVCEPDFSSARPINAAFEQSPESVVFSADGKVAVANFNESKYFAAIDISNDKLLLDSKKAAE